MFKPYLTCFLFEIEDPMVKDGIGDLGSISLELETLRDYNRIEEIPAGDTLCQLIFFVDFGCTLTDFEFHNLLCIVQ